MALVLHAWHMPQVSPHTHKVLMGGLMGGMQAEDRAHRIGQKKEVLVLVLVSAGTIEQVILDRAQQKREIDAKVIQVLTAFWFALPPKSCFVFLHVSLAPFLFHAPTFPPCKPPGSAPLAVQGPCCCPSGFCSSVVLGLASPADPRIAPCCLGPPCV